MKYGAEILYKKLPSKRDFVKIGCVRFALHLRAHMNLYPCFPYFLTDEGEIRYRGSSRNAVFQ